MFYCQKLCGEVGFSIKEWNEQQKVIEELEIELQPVTKCEKQCNDCSAIVAERQKRTKDLLSKPIFGIIKK